MIENDEIEKPQDTNDELKSALDELEQEVMDELDLNLQPVEHVEGEKFEELMDGANPYKPYRVINPFEVSFTIPDDDHNTEVIIRTKVEEVRYGKNRTDVRLQKNIDNRHGRAVYAKHIVDWIRPRFKKFDWSQCHLEYTGDMEISLMTNKEVKDYREWCLYEYDKEYE